MIKKFRSILGICMLVTAHQFALAQTQKGDVEEGNATSGSDPVPVQDNRRLSNQELTERIYTLESHLADEQLSLETLDVELRTSLAEARQLKGNYQKLIANIRELEAELSRERDGRIAGVEALQVDVEDLATKLSAEEIGRLSTDNALHSDIEDIDQIVRSNQKELADIAETTTANKNDLTALDTRVSQSDSNIAEQGRVMGDRYDGIQNTVSSRTLYGGIATVIFVLIIVQLTRRMISSRQLLAGQIADSSESFQKQHVDIDLKLTELFERQLANAPTVNAIDSGDGSTDHSLPLQVAAEIYRMRKRLSGMPDGTKGVQPLIKALERLDESLESKDYEIVDLLGAKYIEGMTIQASFVADDELDSGEKIITRVTKPQVNFKGKIIQVADVEVSKGE